MLQFLPARWLAVLSAFAALNVSAQTPTALEDYQPFTDDKLIAWKEANDTVGKVGGWRTYAKEAQESQVPGTPMPTTSDAPNPHAEHGKP